MHKFNTSWGALALALVFSLVVVACGGSEDKAPKKDSGAAKPAAPAKSEPAKPAAASGVDMTKVGSVTGKAMFKGQAPAPKELDTSKDSWCGEHSKVFDESLVVDGSGGLRDVVVYIEGLDAIASKFPAPSGPARLVQEGCHYRPHVLVLRTEQELEVVNADETSHNYHFTGRANDEINKTQPKPGTDIVQFDSAEMNAKFACDIHPWMNCQVHIFDHPCFAVSAADGSFTISGIPAGNWKVRFMHANAKTAMASMDVTITAGGTKDLGAIDFN